MLWHKWSAVCVILFVVTADVWPNSTGHNSDFVCNVTMVSTNAIVVLVFLLFFKEIMHLLALKIKTCTQVKKIVKIPCLANLGNYCTWIFWVHSFLFFLSTHHFVSNYWEWFDQSWRNYRYTYVAIPKNWVKYSCLIYCITSMDRSVWTWDFRPLENDSWEIGSCPLSF